MWYVIPLVIFLVVLIILKKREDANKELGSEKSKKLTQKKSNKKTPAKTARPSSQSLDSVAEASITSVSKAKEIDAELKNNIESLIQTKNYSSAEAKINQALNQDSNLHELYLYLFEIHSAQKDEFAIKQLINYLRSLGLHDIADQADLKHRQNLSAHNDNTTSVDANLGSKSTLSARSVSSSAAFDELINPNLDPVVSFDSAQVKTTEEEPEEQVDPANPFGAIEYKLDHEPATKLETALSNDAEAFLQNETAPVEIQVETELDSAQLEQAENEAVATQEQVQPAVEIAPLEFSFNTDPVKEKKETPPLAEDFIFDQQTPQVSSTETVENEFKLERESAQPLAPEPINLAPIPEFTFSLDTPISADPQILSFETPAFDFAQDSTTQQVEVASEHAHDPLAQSFPELLQVNEIQLNLDLAEKYIELGAYTAARQILQQNEADYSIEQRDRSQKLLNQIAS